MVPAASLIASLYAIKPAPKVVLNVTGGGGSALSWLLKVPNASNVILELGVPYAQTSLTEFIGKEPEKFCSASTAIDMARCSYLRALRVNNPNISSRELISANLKAFHLGLGCTASIRSAVPKRGEHRAYLATYSATGSKLFSVLLDKGTRTREEEDDLLGILILRALFDACHLEIPSQFGLELLDKPGDKIEVTDLGQDGDCLRRVVGGEVGYAVYPGGESSGRAICDFPFRGIVFPGSFNPVHEGHEALALLAIKKFKEVRQLTEDPFLAFELAVTNADKAPISEDEAKRRIAQFSDTDRVKMGPWPVIISNQPRFLEKAKLFKGCAFVIGADTAVRLVDPKYYANSRERMLMAILEMQQSGCSFIVAGRMVKDAFLTWKTIEDLVPEEVRPMFIGIEEAEFRMDISSTEIRNRLAQ